MAATPPHPSDQSDSAPPAGSAWLPRKCRSVLAESPEIRAPRVAEACARIMATSDRSIWSSAVWRGCVPGRFSRRSGRAIRRGRRCRSIAETPTRPRIAGRERRVLGVDLRAAVRVHARVRRASLRRSATTRRGSGRGEVRVAEQARRAPTPAGAIGSRWGAGTRPAATSWPPRSSTGSFTTPTSSRSMATAPDEFAGERPEVQAGRPWVGLPVGCLLVTRRSRSRPWRRGGSSRTTGTLKACDTGRREEGEITIIGLGQSGLVSLSHPSRVRGRRAGGTRADGHPTLCDGLPSRRVGVSPTGHRVKSRERARADGDRPSK